MPAQLLCFQFTEVSMQLPLVSQSDELLLLPPLRKQHFLRENVSVLIIVFLTATMVVTY